MVFKLWKPTQVVSFSLAPFSPFPFFKDLDLLCPRDPKAPYSCGKPALINPKQPSSLYFSQPSVLSWSQKKKLRVAKQTFYSNVIFKPGCSNITHSAFSILLLCFCFTVTSPKQVVSFTSEKALTLKEFQTTQSSFRKLHYTHLSYTLLWFLWPSGDQRLVWSSILKQCPIFLPNIKGKLNKPMRIPKPYNINKKKKRAHRVRNLEAKTSRKRERRRKEAETAGEMEREIDNSIDLFQDEP